MYSKFETIGIPSRVLGTPAIPRYFGLKGSLGWYHEEANAVGIALVHGSESATAISRLGMDNEKLTFSGFRTFLCPATVLCDLYLS